MTARYTPTIGLEIHAQLSTATKLFCGCSAEFGAKPNRNVCPVCLGLPGALPALNAAAVRLALRVGVALGCQIRERSVFARKNYFYADLPKGYQISQYAEPICEHGHVEVDLDGRSKRVNITRVHMEEDAGKSVHGVGDKSWVDLNRAGVPLVEIVSEPEIESAAEAAAYMKTVRDILVFCDVNDGNLEQGSLRCDANVSVREEGATELGTRTELKNLNSFRFLSRAIELEIARQVAIVSSGGRVVQETRSFDPEQNVTRTLRSKEDAHDYRYFPDPDLLPLAVDSQWIAEEAQRVGELPLARRQRYESELGLSGQAALVLTQHPKTVELFEAARALGADAIKLANWITSEAMKNAQIHGRDAVFSVNAAQLAELVGLVQEGRISGKQAKEVFAAMEHGARMPSEIVKERGMERVSNEAELLPICQQLVAEHPKQVEQIRDGKKGMLGFFVGQVMKRTGGAADPRVVSELLTRLIESGH
ncbi:MAG: Asp-tRNA(Asn)/Glu-tRNA(Gln) amidotransferase subunit GatB [Polyangiaceae bacterium]